MTTVLDPPQGAGSSAVTDTGPLKSFQELFEPELLAWLDHKKACTLAEAADLGELTGSLREFIERGGKRLRPALVYFAYRACGGEEQKAVLPLAMSTELLHTYLLIHDDIMDSAALRRGRPTAHLLFETDHRRRRWRGSSERHGESVAILLGDLAHSYAVELLFEAESRLGQARLAPCFVAMCQEVVLGQYLEMTAPFRDGWRKDDLLKVLRLKSGRYSVERPIELGALAARAPDATFQGLKTYGRALGEAFQLKDDLLGVFGASDTVGKSVDSDIAEGKFTVLVQQALEKSDESGRALLGSALGNRAVTDAELDEVRRIVEGSGAKAEVEQMIARRLERAANSIAGLELSVEAETFFRGLIDFLRDREH
ncbi:MAG: polyprenyl synthetase family protein [Thermoanaerobaculia bacterium]